MGTPAAAPVPPPDLRKAVSALVRAFWDYPETCHLLPAADTRRRVLPRYLGCDCADAQSYGTLLGVEEDGRFVGAAAWLPPDGYPISTRRQLRQLAHLAPALPWCIDSAREALRGSGATRGRHRTDPHYFLRSLGVLPDHQRSGVGGALLAPILERADVEGVGCYLTTARFENVAYYDRFGFTVRDEFRPTPTWPVVWSMWRDPR